MAIILIPVFVSNSMCDDFSYASLLVVVFICFLIFTMWVLEKGLFKGLDIIGVKIK